MMKSRFMRYFRFILFAVCLAPSITNAQSNTPSKVDFESWWGGEFRYRPIKKLSFNFQQQFRLKEYSTQFDRTLSQIETEYKLSKNFEIAGGMRFTWENDNVGKKQGIETHFRYQFDAAHKFRKKRFGFKNRLRYQRSNELGVSEIEGDYPATDFRLKSSMEYDIRKWKLDPKISCEWFYHKQIGELNAFKFFTFSTKTRFRLETNYKIKKGQNLEFFYMFETGTEVWSPKRARILGARFIYTINHQSRRNINPQF